jgi:S-adenosylmethionine hydrolase
MANVITLTTDFGHKGPFVAVMKGMILRYAPEIQVIDLTHEIYVHWPAEAGFWLGRAYDYFPKGTVHVAVVDPGVGTSRNIIAAVIDGHIFLAPDNGLLPQIIGHTPDVTVYRMSEQWRETQPWPAPSSTFHGRDIFAPLAAEMATGRIEPRDIGPIVDDLVPCLLDDPVVDDRQIRGTIIAIDHFGNLITNIDASLLQRFANPEIRAAGHRLNLMKTYGHSQPGDYLGLINSFGVLEIARAESSAAEGLGLGHGAPVFVTDRPTQSE